MNKPGGDGVAAEGYVNAHRGDGHYILLTASNILVNPLMGIGSVRYTDVTPISMLTSEYAIVTGRPDLPYTGPRDLMVQLKKSPGSLSVAVAPGLGSSTQIGFAILAQVAGADPAALHIIPYSSAGQAVTAVIGKQIDLLPSSAGNVQGLIQSGKLRAFGVLGPNRLPGALANIPTWRELGYDATYDTWRGILGAKGLSTEQVAYWDGIFATMSKSDEWKQVTGQENEIPDYRNTEAFKEFLRSEDQKNRDILGRINLLKEEK
jgi:putative tricarboxylic transport membrane protein